MRVSGDYEESLEEVFEEEPLEELSPMKSEPQNIVENLEPQVPSGYDPYEDSSMVVIKTGTNLPPLKLTGGKIAGAFFMWLLGVFLLSLTVVLVYSNKIAYPDREIVVEESTGRYALDSWMSKVRSLQGLEDGSYLGQEVVYANGDEYKINFYKSMLSTVKYIPDNVNVKNKYGNDYIDKKSKSVVQEPSFVSEGEELTLEYIDYSLVDIDKSLVQETMLSHQLTFGAVDYQNKLVDVFCDYMQKVGKVAPTKIERRVPSIVKANNGYSVSLDEDIYLDKLLFSSDDFRDLAQRFSEAAAEVTGGKVEIAADWIAWSTKSIEEKAITVEPNKYNFKQVLPMDWCGTYYLQNEYASGGKKEILAGIGTGTFDNPAGLNTPILTSVYVTEEEEVGTGEFYKKGKKKGQEKMTTQVVVNEYPIKVSLVDYKVSEDAILWFMSKDERNRGLDTTSEVQYCAYCIEVTNLSNKVLTISDNSCLSDSNINLFPRSGELYGLITSVTLQPDESGIIESWSKSTELNKKYLVWGADFARRSEPVWFRVLAGDIDDPSEDKGVSINKTRGATTEAITEVVTEAETATN